MSNQNKGLQTRTLSWKPKGNEDYILKGIDLSFEPGNIYGILGPNGSGKSSFLRHVMGFLPADRGMILWNGKELREYKRKEFAKEAAFVPQETRFETGMTVWELVLTGRNPYQGRFERESETDKKKAEDALCFTCCEDLKDRTFASLSGGEAQRVIVSRAIAQDTDWIILDEPVSSLDIRHQILLMDQLERLNREKGVSILIVLHDINLAGRYCREIIFFKDGRVLRQGRKEDVLTCGSLEEVYEIPFREFEEKGRRYFYPTA